MHHRTTIGQTVLHPRRRRRFSSFMRQPLRGRLVGTVLALAAGSLAFSTVSRAESVTAALGTSKSVFVALHEIQAGAEITLDDIESRELPVGVIPDGTETSPLGRTVIETIHPGEPVITARLAPEGATGPAALIPAGHRGIAIPLDTPVPVLAVGDHVDILGSRSFGATTQEARSSDERSPVVARSVVVVEVSETAVTVAVPDADLASVARALSEGVVIIALAGPG